MPGSSETSAGVSACGETGTSWPLDSKHEGRVGLGLAVGDVDGDGLKDVALVDGTRLLLFRGHVNLSFHPGQAALALPRPVAVAMADFNGDGRDDFVVANDHRNKALAIVINTAKALKVTAFYSAGSHVQSVAQAE